MNQRRTLTGRIHVALLAGCVGLLLVAPTTGAGAQERRPAMQLRSPAFQPKGTIPRPHTCDGEDLSPALEWSGMPEKTRSFALILDDPDAPPGTWVHWVLYDLPAEARSLAAGLPKTERLGDGSAQGLGWGVSSFSRVGYYGPCPPPGPAHRYVFRLYALGRKLELPPKQTAAQLREAMQGRVLAEASLIGLYGR